MYSMSLREVNILGNGPENEYGEEHEKGNYVTVTPDTLWPIAVTGTIDRQGNPPVIIIPIERVRMCPATVTVIRDEYPQGVLLLNDSPPPQGAAPEDFLYIEESGQSVEVEILANVGWPYCNKVVLWK
jgi:hypothetical protein